jgi:pimeloyl-ACP methyl ester carboxylesterase
LWRASIVQDVPTGDDVQTVEVRRADGGVVALEMAGDRGGAPLLVCHGLADSRLSAQLLAQTADELGFCVVAPDRPGVGLTDPRRLERLADWVEDAALVLGALRLESVAVLGISGGGPFAAACAAAFPRRVRGLLLVSPLGMIGWGTRGMAAGQRFSLGVAKRAPGFGAWFLGRLAQVARRSPQLFLYIATSELPEIDRHELRSVEQREAFVASYIEAFRRGSAGVAQDLRLLTRPWGFDLGSIRVPTWIHHGQADTTVPPHHARRFAEAIPGAQLRLHHRHGHFSLLAAEATEMLTQVSN